MANRKVLINYHTSGSSAPNPQNVYEGEIVVAHETGKETLFTKNNAGNMVPFISCAQTITMIDNAITAANVTYTVTAGTGEEHIEVAAGGTDKAKTYTVTSKDVQSEEEFKAYSAATKTRIDTNVSAITDMLGLVSGLTDIVVTDISGDTIIVAEKVDNDSGSNTYNLTHRTATAVTGFNKLDTDAYGHVTAATAVAQADIDPFLTTLSASVVTNETNITNLSGEVVAQEIVVAQALNDLDTRIKGMDSSTAVTAGKYMTGIAITDGKISGITEADLPELSVVSAGTGNVVSQITVNGHEITYQTASVATSEGISALSAATINLSGAAQNNESMIEALSAGTIQLSADTDAAIAQLSAGTIQLSADTKNAIDALSAGTIQLSADTKAAIDALSAGTVHDVTELSGAVQANETAINNLSAATLDLSAVTLTGVSLNNDPLAVNNHIVSVPVTTSGSGIANATDSGSVADALAVKEYVEDTLSSAVEYKGATGATPSNPAKGDLYIASSDFVVEGSKSAETGDFIIYDGTKWDVIEKNLDGAITGTLTQNTVTLGDSTNSVKSLANGANGTVLTMVDGAPAWANDPELSVVSAGTGNVVSDITVNDHEITFTKGVTAADDADLQALSGVVEDFSAATHSEITALSAGTIQLSGDVVAYVNALSANAHNSMIARDDEVFSSAATYTDEQIDEVYASGVSYTDSAITVAIEALDSSTATTDANHYLTSITITNGEITAMGEAEVPAGVSITATTATPVDTASAVLTGVTANGTDNHSLTFGMSNKVFSATTADSAITSVSALTTLSANSADTALHADAAAKVDSALTINIIDATGGTATTVFDGSENQTINLTNTDTATTEAGHYAPATAASTTAATAGSFISAITLDSKNHVIGVGTADKVNSATTTESADTAAVADKVANALSVSGYSSETAATLDTAVAYDGSAAQALTFGTVGNAGLNSMTMTSAGVVDVDVIDCGTY